MIREASSEWRWVVDGCYVRNVPDGMYSYAITHGNGAYIHYENRTWDYAWPWDGRYPRWRLLDYRNTVVSVYVDC